jgi:hypothetical protein
MNPLGDELGPLAAFGLSTVLVLIMSVRLRTYSYAVLRSALVGMACGMAVYAFIAVISLLFGGTGPYKLDWWLVLVGVGLVPAGVIGFVEGLIASIIIRQFERFAQGSE